MSRQAAFDMLERVDQQGAYSHLAVDEVLEERDLSDADRRLATRLAYGVLTWRQALDSVLDDVVDGGIRRLDGPVLQALRVGAFQLFWLDRIPEHAAVDETVKLVESIGYGQAKGLVNAVMRRLAARDEKPVWWAESERESNPVRFIAERYSLPTWLTNRLVQLYGADRAEALAASLNERPPIFLRVDAEDAVAESSFEVEPVEGVPGCLRIEDVELRGRLREAIESSGVSVQDLGSQLVGWFTGAEQGERVLDACAGLGGKTFQLANQVGPEGEVVALDRHRGKLEELQRTLEVRDRGEEEIIETVRDDLVAYAREHSAEESERFDRVLLDAPCSALGTIRRHPEIRWRRREADIPSLVETQRELLEAASKLVAPGGLLVYAVCTFLSEETTSQVADWLESEPEYESVDPPDHGRVDWSSYVNERWLETNPVDHDADLFFAARLRRSPPN